MNIFQIAIDREGGICNLAEALGLSTSRVCNWPSRGVPDGWLTVMSYRYAPSAQVKRELRSLWGEAVVGGSEGGGV